LNTGEEMIALRHFKADGPKPHLAWAEKEKPRADRLLEEYINWTANSYRVSPAYVEQVRDALKELLLYHRYLQLVTKSSGG